HNLSPDKKIIALLPGSRRQEINYLLPNMIAVADQYPDHQFIIAGAPSFNKDYYHQYLKGKTIPVLFNATYDILSNAHAAVVASGTATLETALFNVPQVVVYIGNPISISIARMVVKIKNISLVNLVMGKAIVKELIQQDCTPATIGAELDLILNDKTYRQTMLANYDTLDEKMGKPGASAKTAALIVKYSTKQ
ncbi:MAG: lipid-A-disaccharide synthase, partial [Mucilaginibacter sp.]|nr:lipid-A-disaccharide synthase [Mucilaginibacter sp.]